MSERACVAVVVFGVAVLAVVVPLLVAAKVAYGVTPEVPSITIPVSTGYSASLLVGGVAAMGGGVWLLTWAWRTVRRRHETSVAGDPVHGGVPVPEAGGSGARSRPDLISGRDRTDETAVLPRLDGEGMSVVERPWAGRGGYLPAPSGRPTQDIRPRRETAGGGVAASAHVRGVEAATEQLPAVRDGGPPRWPAAGVGEGWAPAALSSRPCPVRGEHGRAVAASDWKTDAATTHEFRAQTLARPDAANVGPQSEIHQT